MHKFRYAALPFGRAQLAVKVFTRDNVGCRLRPFRRDLDVTLFEDHRTFVVANGGRAGLPLNVVIGTLACFEASSEVARESDPGASFWGLSIVLQYFQFRTQVNGDLAHRGSLL